MGYIIRIKANKEIKEQDIDNIVNELPDNLKGPMKSVGKQVWGWPCICDIILPKDNILEISGTYDISGHWAEQFVKFIQIKMDKKGYDTSIEYLEGVLFETSVSKDDRKIKLNPEISTSIPEVQLDPKYKSSGIAVDKIVKLGKNMQDSFDSTVKAMSNLSEKCTGILDKDKCSHCGVGIDLADGSTHYCETCYQKLIIKNSKLQLALKQSIPEDVVNTFMEDLRWILIQPHEVTYTAEMKLRHILELYLRYAPKLGGLKKDESND